MKRIIKYMLSLALIVVASISCERQTIYDPELLTANIPIVIDWTGSTVDESDINSVSVYFYPEDGSDPIIVYSSDPYLVTATLKEGIYDIVLHNEIAGNIKGVDCIGSESIDDYKMVMQQDDATSYDMFYEPNAGDQLIKESEAIASWSYRGFEVTRDLIEYTRTRSFEEIITRLQTKSQEQAQARSTKSSDDDFIESLTRSLTEELSSLDSETRAVTKSLEDLNGVAPTSLTVTYKVTIEIENINNIQYIEGVIDGFADGAEVASGDKIVSTTNNFTFMQMSDYTLDEGSTTDGVLNYTFSNFGHSQMTRSEQTYTLTLNIIIHSGERFTKSFDITDDLSNYTIGESLYINIGDSYDNGSSTIVLPENQGAGFGVDEWGDAENIQL